MSPFSLQVADRPPVFALLAAKPSFALVLLQPNHYLFPNRCSPSFILSILSLQAIAADRTAPTTGIWTR